MSEADEQARAAAYRLSEQRRAAYRRTRLLALRGSASARKALEDRWAAWGPADVRPATQTPAQPVERPQ